MIYDRPYMKSVSDNSYQQKSMVLMLLVITVGVFVLQNVLHILLPDARIIENLFVLNTSNLFEGKVWTLLTYSFLHSYPGLFHIFANMLGLYFIGRVIEPIIGAKSFLYLYLSSAIVGALCYLSLHMDPSQGLYGLVGASASVSGILAFFCLIKPEERITLLLFFVLPISLKPKWLLRGYLTITVLFLFSEELTGAVNIAHSAHLGGILTGFIYYRFFYKDSSSPFSQFREPTIELPKWFKKQKKRFSNVSYTVNYSDQKKQMKAEVNIILDKINLHGFESLTEKEAETLKKAHSLFDK